MVSIKLVNRSIISIECLNSLPPPCIICCWVLSKLMILLFYPVQLFVRINNHSFIYSNNYPSLFALIKNKFFIYFYHIFFIFSPKPVYFFSIFFEKYLKNTSIFPFFFFFFYICRKNIIKTWYFVYILCTWHITQGYF